MKPILFACAAVCAAASVPAAAVTVVPVSAVASTQFPAYEASNAIDQGPGSDVSDFAFQGQQSGGTLDLDLGQVFTLSSVSLVDRVTSGGGNNAFFGGTTDFTTSFSLQGFSDAGFTSAIGSAQLFNKMTPGAPTTLGSFGFISALTTLSAQYVRYTVVASNGPNPGLSNISFEGTLGAVPEPASWAMLIAGFGLVGAAARRRRQAVVSA